MFSRQPMSPASTVSAPVCWMSFALSPTIRVEMSGYFTQKVPPKPQQISGSAISFNVRPATPASSARGCAFTPISRRPAQESW